MSEEYTAAGPRGAAPSAAAAPGRAKLLPAPARFGVPSRPESTMAWIALVGPEIEENLSLRYIASSLAEHGFASTIVPFNQDTDFGPALNAVLNAPEPPLA